MEYKEIVDDYKRTVSDIKSKLTSISVVVIGAIYFVGNSAEGSLVLKYSLISLVFTMAIEVVSGYLKVAHYSKCIDGKVETIDFRESWQGKTVQFLFHAAIFPFILGILLFLVGFLG